MRLSTATRRACGAGCAGAASASTSAATTARPARPAASPADVGTVARGGMSPNSDAGARAPVRLMQVVGARPQFVKLAPVCRAIATANAGGANIESFVAHTGQHYDPAMSDVFFAELGIPEADLDLGVGSGSHGRQTARMLESLEAAMVERRPHLVLTYGDTNSTLAATLAAAKLHLPLAHVEAGLRSFNRRMPEETNRVVADHLSDLLFAPTPEAMKNLASEGLAARARQVGDVMLDAMRAFAPVALERSRVLERLELAPATTTSLPCTAPRTPRASR